MGPDVEAVTDEELEIARGLASALVDACIARDVKNPMHVAAGFALALDFLGRFTETRIPRTVHMTLGRLGWSQETPHG